VFTPKPTEKELEILQIVWEKEAVSVKDVHEALGGDVGNGEGASFAGPPIKVSDALICIGEAARGGGIGRGETEGGGRIGEGGRDRLNLTVGDGELTCMACGVAASTSDLKSKASGLGAAIESGGGGGGGGGGMRDCWMACFIARRSDRRSGRPTIFSLYSFQ